MELLVLPKKEVALLNKQRVVLKILGWYRRYASYPRRNVRC